MVKDGKENNFPLASFLGALSYAQRVGCRYYFVLSGLPNLKTNLKEAKTYTERMFTFKEAANLPQDEAKKAIVEPLKKSDYSFEPQLIDKIVDESRGYPYFLQFYGFYLIKTSGSQKVGIKDFNKKRVDLCHELDISFFEDRYNLASEKEKLVLLAMAKSKSEKISMKDLSRFSKMEYHSLIENLKRLIDKGLIYKYSRATYAFTTPLFMEYLQKQI